MDRMNIYRCALCGNIVEVLHVGGGTLVCCGQPMTPIAENTTDAATEKHVPVLEKTADTVNVKVGTVAHPMADDHFIQWIEVTCDCGVCRQMLKPGDAPQATFDCSCGDVTAREYCNIHGLWKG